MNNAFLFPGQASQFEGMGLELYENNTLAKELFEQANDILGFKITDVMFRGSAEELLATKITQPAVFLHSVITLLSSERGINPKVVAGHSLGEFSALVANKTLSLEDGLKLVSVRANAMEAACNASKGTMAAIVGLEDEKIEAICRDIEDVVVPANYNCPGQLVISGSEKGIDSAIEKLTAEGAKRAIKIAVGGAFHSPLMSPAQEELEKAINDTEFSSPNIPIYQNVSAKPTTDPAEIKLNLISQLTSSVRWTQTMQNMISDGATTFYEVGGKGRILAGFIRRIDRSIPVESL